MLKAAQYIAVIAAFFLPWLIGAMRNSIKSKNRKSLLLASILCAVDVFLIAFFIALAFALNK